ncbi:hypothetical protein B0O95_103136 [Mycetohabitans endofungorum]|uniref:Uncharacterized protein n=1 Tax=Mycetohabitans endofungorum TaxID=417203 RepID=A0A2P5KCL7_9BURK|nr:hypothetical protein B0O95_103136 [Mycetohabitans endofungorum]
MPLHAAPLSQYSMAITLVVREFVLALPVEPDIWPVSPLLECADRDDTGYVLGPAPEWHPGKVNGIRAFVDPSGSRVLERSHVTCSLRRIFPSRCTSAKPMRWPSTAAITVTPRNTYRMASRVDAATWRAGLLQPRQAQAWPVNWRAIPPSQKAMAPRGAMPVAPWRADSSCCWPNRLGCRV